MAGKQIEINLREESSDPFEFLVDVTSRGGDTVHYDGPLGETYIFNHPDSIRQFLQSHDFVRTTLIKIVLGEGMLASDGETWRARRYQASPFFRRDVILEFAPLINARTSTVLAKWAQNSESGQTLDVSWEMTQLTLSVIVDGLFGVDLQSRMPGLGDALDVLLNDLGEMSCTQLNTPLTFSASGQQRFQSALDTVNNFVAEIIEERRRKDDDPANFLSTLLSAQDEDTGRPLSDRHLRDEVVSMMIAGHETTALILSWAWHLLAEHPDVERRLHQELDDVLGDRMPTFADLEHLPYTLMVLRETMRLYPPVWYMARKTTAATEVNGCLLPENVIALVSPYTIHRHPDFWPNPDEFDPLRFAPDKKQTKYSYIPFGGGHHLCLGMNLALMEGHLILASLAKNYIVRPLPECPVKPRPAITLRLQDGLRATVSKRVATPARRRAG
jgi:cytochrome P450